MNNINYLINLETILVKVNGLLEENNGTSDK